MIWFESTVTDEEIYGPLLSDEPTIELIIRAKGGDPNAVGSALAALSSTTQTLGARPAAGRRPRPSRHRGSRPGIGHARARAHSMRSSRGTSARCRPTSGSR